MNNYFDENYDLTKFWGNFQENLKDRNMAAWMKFLNQICIDNYSNQINFQLNYQLRMTVIWSLSLIIHILNFHKIWDDFALCDSVGLLVFDDLYLFCLLKWDRS